MNIDLYKSIALSMPVYKMLRELADKKFELPISLSKTTEFLIKKSHDEYKKENGKSKK